MVRVQHALDSVCYFELRSLSRTLRGPGKVYLFSIARVSLGMRRGLLRQLHDNIIGERSRVVRLSNDLHNLISRNSSKIKRRSSGMLGRYTVLFYFLLVIFEFVRMLPVQVMYAASL